MKLAKSIRGGILAASLSCASTAIAAPTSLHCTNTSSGAQWTLPVDLANKTVDDKPAVITDTEITWQDTDTGPSYSFDRSSGVMTKISASSTGGNILYERCQLK